MIPIKVNRNVFFTSATVIIAFIIFGAGFTELAGRTFTSVQSFLVDHFGWFYILSVSGFLAFVVYLFFSPFGTLTLGKPHDTPDYSYTTWFAMLFSAGMGIGLMFFGVAEPVSHYMNPRLAEAGTIAAAREAMVLSMFHWGLHAWAIYIVIGLALAYFGFRHDLPFTIRSTLYPVLGRRIYGPIGDLVDIMAVFGTMFGIATSLGIGALQINAGLAYLGILGESTFNQVILILVIAGIATISVFLGLDRGIRRLSELNLGLAMILLGFVLLAGPTVFLLSSWVQSLGGYLTQVVPLSFQTDAFRGPEWQSAWTMFYWGWWISWSPFVGMFIARISRGRTIREFIAGVLLVPTLVTTVWIVVFGNTAIHMHLLGGNAIVVDAVDTAIPTALFAMLSDMPFAAVTSLIAVVLVTTYFVTSSDSGSLVTDTLTAGGQLDTPAWQRVFWALMKGLIAAVLLIAGGLSALQTAAITTAAPFCVIMIVICYSLYKSLRDDWQRLGRSTRRGRRDTAAELR